MQLIRKLTIIGTAVLLLVASILSSSNYAAASGSYYFGFEDADGVAPFMPMANGVAKLPGLSLERVTGENGCPSLHGDAYARLKTAPDYGPLPLPPTRLGTWIDASVPARGANQVTIEFAARSIEATEGAIPIVYIGPDMPRDANQFTLLQGNLSNTWQHFRFAAMTATSANVYVAIGWAGDYGSIGIDCISVNVQSVTLPPSSGADPTSLGSGK